MIRFLATLLLVSSMFLLSGNFTCVMRFFPHPSPAFFPQLWFPCLILCCFWPIIIRRREVFVRIETCLAVVARERRPGKGLWKLLLLPVFCCSDFLWPLSLNVGWTCSSHMEVPLEPGWKNYNISASLSWYLVQPVQCLLWESLAVNLSDLVFGEKW